MKRIHVLPNLITSANAFCGFLAIIKVTRALSEQEPEFLLHGAWYIFLAMVFDALDGKVARMVNAATDFGAQLDSLCDVISFGVAPAYLVYVLQTQFAPQTVLHNAFSPEFAPFYSEKFLFMASAIYVCCAIMRLARFNVEVGLDEEDHRVFKGIPTPAAAGVLASLVIIFFNTDMAQMVGDRVDDGGLAAGTKALHAGILTALPWYTLACSVLMVSSLRFIHLITVIGNSRVRFEYLVAVVILVVLIYVKPELSLFVGFQLYLLSGPVFGHLMSRRELAVDAEDS